MKRYPEYKDSGIEWIAEIPKHWESKRLGHVSTIFKGGTPKRNVDRYFQGDLPWARPVDITALQGVMYIQDTKIHITEEALNNSAAKRLPQGTVLLTSRATIGETAITTVPMATNQGFANFVCNEQLFNVYLAYYLQAIKEVLISLGSGSTYLEVTKGTLVGVRIPLPPFSEQIQIATFLNRKTEQIDELVRIKERQIELLQEQRTALISQTVTKGLAPDVEMKPSGVEWIGEIPIHWNLSMLKYAARLVYGDTLISENREKGVVPVYGSNGVIDTHSSANTLSPAIIVGRKGSLGKIQYSDVPCFVIDTAYYIDSRTSHANLRWLYYVLHAIKLERFRNSVLPGLNRDAAEGQHVPLITVEEQTQIANFLDQKTKQIDKLISAEHRKIQLLKEYRQSLISEAVTGKIDVRNEV